MSSTDRITRLALAGLMVGVLPGCGEDPPATVAPIVAEEAEAPAPEPAVVLAVDAFGNLKALGKAVHGFELPRASEVSREDAEGRPSVIYVQANKERLERFFRSRGHNVIETLSGWKVEHTERTLDELGAEAAGLRKASITAKRGPGPGWTLRYDRGEVKPLRKPALLAQLEAEQVEATAAAPTAEAEPAAAPAPNQDEKTPGLFQDERGGAVAGGRGSGANPSGRGSAARSASKSKARRVVRGNDRARGRDVSGRVIEYVKANPDRGFLD